MFKNKAFCSDSSRRKITFRDENGKHIEDQGGTKLSKKFFVAIKEDSTELLQKRIEEIQLSDLDWFDNPMLREMCSNLGSNKTNIKKASENENEFARTFIVKLCSLICHKDLQLED